MSDVEVKCEHCGAPITLSEYAAMNTISCRGCGAPLRAHPTSPTDSVRERLRLRKPEPPPSDDDADGQQPTGQDEADTWRFERYIEQSRGAIQPETQQTGVVWSWLLFVVIAAIMASIRFLGLLPESLLFMLQTYAPYAALLIHIIIVLTAFKDTVFQGILCLLIPGYSVFYLFLVSDNFWMRAGFGGLLVGIGLDSAIFYRDLATKVYHAISDYIASGG